jgi:hypothetical protein
VVGPAPENGAVMARVLGITRDGSELRLAVAGDWKLSKGLPSIETVARAVALDPPEDVDPAVGLRRGELGDTGTPTYSEYSSPPWPP